MSNGTLGTPHNPAPGLAAALKHLRQAQTVLEALTYGTEFPDLKAALADLIANTEGMLERAQDEREGERYEDGKP